MIDLNVKLNESEDGGEKPIVRLSDEEKDELNDFFREKEIKYGV